VRFSRIILMTLCLTMVAGSLAAKEGDVNFYMAGNYIDIYGANSFVPPTHNSYGFSVGIGYGIYKFNEIILVYNYASFKHRYADIPTEYKSSIYDISLEFIANIPGAAERTIVPFFVGGIGYVHLKSHRYSRRPPNPPTIRYNNNPDYIFRFGSGVKLHITNKIFLSVLMDYNIVLGWSPAVYPDYDMNPSYYQYKIGLSYRLSKN